MSLSERVKYAIITSGKNQYELAEILNISQPAVNRYVNGTSNPRESGLKKLAQLTNLDYDWLKTGSGKVPLGFKDFINSTTLKDQQAEKIKILESKVERLQSEVKRLKRENELLERLTEKENVRST